MKVVSWTLCAAIAMTACTVDPADSRVPHDEEWVRSHEHAIIGGVTDSADACVVAVFAHAPGATSGNLCTGTRIASRTVLTAARCVDPRIIGAGQVVEILSGTTIRLPGIVASSATSEPLWNPSNPLGGHDVGVVHVPDDPNGELCPPYFHVPLLQPKKIVGYGRTTHTNTSTGEGTRRQVTVNISAMNEVLFQAGNSNAQICNGDIGGPVFETVDGRQMVVGVSSFIQDSSCSGGGFHSRVDASELFINSNTL